jgi:hypothetical protein
MMVLTARGYHEITISSVPPTAHARLDITPVRGPQFSPTELVELLRTAPLPNEPALWARLQGVPNRLFGTVINSEGDAV